MGKTSENNHIAARIGGGDVRSSWIRSAVEVYGAHDQLLESRRRPVCAAVIAAARTGRTPTRKACWRERFRHIDLGKLLLHTFVVG